MRNLIRSTLPEPLLRLARAVRRGLLPGGAATGPAEVYIVWPEGLEIPDRPFAEGFSARPMRADEVDTWVRIQCEAEEHLDIDRATFHREFTEDPATIESTCFFVTNPEGEPIGTISAWPDRDQYGREAGRPHWLAVRPAYQGLGLAKAAMVFSMKQLATRFGRLIGRTDSARIPAIKLYLDLGFLPDLDRPNGKENWSRVKEQLPHPALEW